MTRPRRVTMRDVARLAQTSTAVVSYVVNNGPRSVAPATRARVLQAIDTLNYQPDRMAQALAHGQSQACGLIVPDITNPFFASLANALEDELFATGRSLFVGNSSESRERETELVDNFLQFRIGALFFIGVDAAGTIDKAELADVPVVLLDRVSERTRVPSVTIDNVAAARAATNHLIALGYREIAHIEGPSHLSVARDRRAGFEQAVQGAAVQLTVSTILAPFDREGGLVESRRWIERELRSGHLPSAVFASNEQQALGFLRAAAEHGIVVPADVALATIDGTRDSEFSVPRLTSVVQPVGLIAREAVQALSSWASGDVKHCDCPFELVIRESCGANVATSVGNVAKAKEREVDAS